jgi:hypothetical protein
MSDEQLDFYTMLTKVDGFLFKNITIVESIPAFNRGYLKLNPILVRIKNIDSGRESIGSGVSDIKTDTRNKLIECLIETDAGLYTYAAEHNKPEILSRVDKPNSYYKRMRDTNLILEATGLAELTKGIETELAEHGLAATDLTKLNTLSSSFEQMIKEMGTSGSEGVNATSVVYQLIGEAKDLVEKLLDKYALQVKKNNEEFYVKYMNSRNVVETGVRHGKEENAADVTNSSGATDTTKK